jgi:hypothetical protein
MPYTPIQPKVEESSFWEQLGNDLTKTLLNTGVGALTAGAVGTMFPAAAPAATTILLGMPLAQGVGQTTTNALGMGEQPQQQPSQPWYQSRMNSFTGRGR